MYVSEKNVNDLIRTTNNELVTVSKWLASSKMTLNLEKSHYVIFNRNKIFPEQMPPLSLCSKTLIRKPFTKFLGITIDEQLNWKEHILNVTNKINKQIGILYLTRDSLTITARKQIYHSLIYPHLTYGNTVWGAVCQTTIKPIVIAQKRAIRTIMELRRYDHTHNSFCSLKLLKFIDINKYFSALFVFKSLKIYNNNIFQLRNTENYGLRFPNMLIIPITRSNQSEQCIQYHGVIIWNDLPTEVRNASSITSFKRILKKHLLLQYANIT